MNSSWPMKNKINTTQQTQVIEGTDECQDSKTGEGVVTITRDDILKNEI